MEDVHRAKVMEARKFYIALIGVAFFAGLAFGQYRASSVVIEDTEAVNAAVSQGFNMVSANQAEINALLKQDMEIQCVTENKAKQEMCQKRLIAKPPREPVILLNKKE